jgi:hypothetical protein
MAEPSVSTRLASVALEAEEEVSEVAVEAVVCLSISCNFELC